MAQHLFLCSTPLHIINAVTIASSLDATDDSHIQLIDQPDIIKNPYFHALSEWKDSPFKSLAIYPGRFPKGVKKLAARRAIFRQLRQSVDSIRPTVIYTGNDRRIEFQYAMHLAKRLKLKPLGCYMDEGTFTYVGRQASSSFADRYVDNVLKKLAYGLWWKNPKTVGASKWISKVYAALPNLVVPELAKKSLINLGELYPQSQALTSFCEYLSVEFAVDSERLRQLSAVATLPHESIINKTPGYREAINTVVQSLLASGGQVGVKYHPRDVNPKVIDSKSERLYVIPYQVPFEALLPQLASDCTLIGDVSSTLINGRCMLPAATILSLANPALPLYDAFTDLFTQLDIPVLTPAELAERFPSVGL